MESGGSGCPALGACCASGADAFASGGGTGLCLSASLLILACRSLFDAVLAESKLSSCHCLGVRGPARGDKFRAGKLPCWEPAGCDPCKDGWEGSKLGWYGWGSALGAPRSRRAIVRRLEAHLRREPQRAPSGVSRNADSNPARAGFSSGHARRGNLTSSRVSLGYFRGFVRETACGPARWPIGLADPQQRQLRASLGVQSPSSIHP